MTTFYNNVAKNEVKFEIQHKSIKNCFFTNKDWFVNNTAKIIDIKSCFKRKAAENLQLYFENTYPNQIKTSIILLIYFWNSYYNVNKTAKSKEEQKRLFFKSKSLDKFSKFKNNFVQLAGKICFNKKK